MEVRIRVHKQVDLIRIYETKQRWFVPSFAMPAPGFEVRTLSTYDKRPKPLNHAAAPVAKQSLR
jgi:hypothetical protein